MGEIDAGRPFAFAWAPNPAGPTGGVTGPAPTISHMLVMTGYVVDPQSSVQLVIYLDPAVFRRTEMVIANFADYDGSNGAFIHEEDYFGILPKTSP